MDLHLAVDPARGLREGLEQALRQAVRDGKLLPGAQLPASRSLAADLGIARGTVAQAYENLVAEGWLLSRQGAGTWVADVHAARAPGRRSWTTLPPVHGVDLRPGLPDLSSFPRKEWLASTRRVLRDAPHDVFGYGDIAGHRDLREVLAEYLGRARGVVTHADQIVVCAGYSSALSLLSKALRRQGARRMAFEDPALPDFPAVAAETGLEIIHTPVDEEGLQVDALGDVDAALVTPAHQYPLGVTLSPSRRSALIDWARRTDAFVLEDDYDGEFHYGRTPPGALQAHDGQRVIYLGTASKSLAPGLRLAWMAVPRALSGPLHDVMTTDESHVSVLDQLVFADMVRTGAFDRHLRYCRTRYKHRRDRLAEALADLPLTGAEAGLHAVVLLPGNGASTADHLRRNGVIVDGLSGYYALADPPSGLVIGYGTPAEHAYNAAVQALAAALKSAPA